MFLKDVSNEYSILWGFRNLSTNRFEIVRHVVKSCEAVYSKARTILQDSITAKERLVLTLRFLATENSCQDLKFSSLIF